MVEETFTGLVELRTRVRLLDGSAWELSAGAAPEEAGAALEEPEPQEASSPAARVRINRFVRFIITSNDKALLVLSGSMPAEINGG